MTGEMEIVKSNSTIDIIPGNSAGAGPEPPFDQETFKLIDVILNAVILSIISVFGIFSNSVNVAMFYQQGILTHSCNVSLTALAVSDFFYCIFVFWGSLCVYIFYHFDTSNYRWDIDNFYTYVSTRPAIMFSEITCWVTAFVAFERVISVVFPFKVKTIFTPKRSFAAISLIYVTIFIIFIPNNFGSIPVWVEFGSDNSTKLVYRSSNFPRPIHVAFLYASITIRVTVVTLVLMCNATISWKVIFSKKFRESTTSTASSSQSQAVAPSTQDPNSLNRKKENEQVNSKRANTDASNTSSNKEAKLVRMIMVICSLFCLCYIVDFLDILLFVVIGWEYGVDYHWMFEYMLLRTATLFQTINSSSNIFIYYTMSARYKADLRLCVCPSKKK